MLYFHIAKIIDGGFMISAKLVTNFEVRIMFYVNIIFESIENVAVGHCINLLQFKSYNDVLEDVHLISEGQISFKKNVIKSVIGEPVLRHLVTKLGQCEGVFRWYTKVVLG